MIRVTHFITDLDCGGAERTLANLVTASDPGRFSHAVVSLRDGGTFAAPLERAGVPVFSLGMTRGRPSIAALMRAAAVLRRRSPAVVQTWLYHADLFGLAAAWLAGGPPVAWNVRCSDMDFSRYRPSTRWIVRLLAKLSAFPAAVVANSEAGRAWHQRIGYRPRRWETIPNGVDTAAFRPDPAARERWRQRLDIGAQDILVGMVARRDPMKDHEGFLEAAKRATARRSGLVFALAGQGVEKTDPALRSLAAGIPAPVHFLGQVEDAAGLMAALDVGVLASRFGEGFPNAVAETMGCGVTCIVTDIGDSARLVGETGAVVPAQDANRLAEAFLALAGAEENERRGRGEAARRRIGDHFSLAAMVARYESLYEELAGGKT